MSKRAPSLDAEIDDLFRLSLEEFTAARNALAARLKKEQRAADAERVKAIAKPPAPAWAVNQLYWRYTKDVEQLLALGERLRKAQAAQLAGKQADLRGLFDERKKVLSALTKQAAAILGEAGGAASPDATRRIAATLEALAAWGHTEGTPRAGRLTFDLDPPGFEALAGLVPGKMPANLLQFPVKRAPAAREKKPAEDPAALRARARAAVQAAEKVLREVRRDAERADATLKKAAARAKELEQRYAEAREAAMTASTEERRAAQQAEQAARAVAAAERDAEKARAALEQYE